MTAPVAARGQVDGVQRGLHPVAITFGCAKAEVGGNGQPLKARRLLPGQRHAPAPALVNRQVRHLLAVQPDMAGIRLVTAAAHERIGQRRFARAVDAQQGVDLAGIDVKIDVLQNRPAVALQFQILYL